MAEDLARLGEAELEQALADLGASMPSPRTRDLADAVLERIAAGGPPPDQPSSGSPPAIQGPLGFGLLGLALLASVVLALVPVVRPDTTGGQMLVVYGGDLTPPERQELARLFGAEGAAAVETVSGEELAAALRAAGLPAAPTDKAISSTALTCRERGAGLWVRTERITRIPAAAYATALLIAGVADGSVIIAAPTTNPVTGETALVGVLKAFPRCRAGQHLEPARVGLAYEQLKATAGLAGNGEDLTSAAAVMLKASQAVITGRSRDDATIAAALDAAAAGEGLSLDAARRSELVAFLTKLADLDYGVYANGFQIRQIAPNEVELVPVAR